MSEHDSSAHLLSLHYEGHQVRTFLDEHGCLWWIAQDLGYVLGLTNIRRRLQTFPDDERGVTNVHTLGGPQVVNAVNEPGMYRLIFASRKPEAHAFKRWVFHDVLPTLRRAGTYAIVQPPDALTPQGHLPPPTPRIREHAEVSWHLAAVWALFTRADEHLTNREIAQRTGIAQRTARAHTRYLLQVGMLDVYETFPRRLYVLAAQAAKRNAGVYQRLCTLTELIQARQQF